MATTIALKTENGDVHVIPIKVARVSFTLRNIIDGTFEGGSFSVKKKMYVTSILDFGIPEDGSPIFLPNVSSGESLKTVLQAHSFI
jgi:hypothetical protein